MRAYICRWPKGDFSVAYAASREEADLLFDEVANPDLARVFPAPARFAIHFELQKNPDPSNCLSVDLECFNEEAYTDLGSKLYPVLFALDEEADPQVVQEAVAKERTWQVKKKPRLSKDSEERHLQEAGHDIPRALTKSIMRDVHRERLQKSHQPKD